MTEEIRFEKYKKRGAYHWKNYFGNIFAIDSFLRGRYDIVIHLLKRSGITNTSSVLEVGCGDGALSGLIYKTFRCNLTGVEPASEGVRFSREMFSFYGFKGTFEVSEGYSFSYPDNHFDFVVLADVIEHLQHPDLMLREIKRVLKKGGKLIVTTPIRTSEYPEDAMHVQEFYPDELIKLCKPYYGEPIYSIYSHPVVWHELYSYGRKFNRSMIRLYCRMSDKLFKSNPFLKTNLKGKWKNFKQQGLLLEKKD
jgi:ubiquinone/menaquinone biosynthesis C-methylase UbiE